MEGERGETDLTLSDTAPDFKKKIGDETKPMLLVGEPTDPSRLWKRPRVWVTAGVRLLRHLHRVRAVQRLVSLVNVVILLRRRMRLYSRMLKQAISSQRVPTQLDVKKNLESTNKNFQAWQDRRRVRATIIREILDWMTVVTGIPAVDDDLLATLRDGKVLCSLLQVIWSDAPICSTMLGNSANIGAKARIVNFLVSCRQLGIGDSMLFKAADILQRNREDVVVNGLLRIALHAIHQGTIPPLCLALELESLLPGDLSLLLSRSSSDGPDALPVDEGRIAEGSVIDSICHRSSNLLRLIRDGEWFRMLDIASPPIEIVMSCSENTLMWCGIASSSDTSWPDMAESIPLANLRYIVEGCRAGATHPDNCCFTVATDDREILLQSESCAVRDRWVTALKYGSFLAKCDLGDFSLLDILLDCISFAPDGNSAMCPGQSPRLGISLASSVAAAPPLRVKSLRLSSSIGSHPLMGSSISDAQSEVVNYDGSSQLHRQCVDALDAALQQIQDLKSERTQLIASLERAHATCRSAMLDLEEAFLEQESSSKESHHDCRGLDPSVPLDIGWIASPNLQLFVRKGDSRRYLQQLAQVQQTVYCDDATKLLLKAHRLYVSRDMRAALQTLRRCCDLAQRSGDLVIEREATSRLAQLMLHLGQFANAYVLFRKVLALEKVLGLDVISSWAQLKAVSAVMSNHGLAVGRLQELRRLYEARPNLFALSLTLETLANEYIAVGLMEKALSTLEHCSSIAQRFGDKAMLRRLQHAKGNLYKREGRIEEALQCYQQSRETEL